MAGDLLMHQQSSLDTSLLSCVLCGQTAEQSLLLCCLHSCCSPCADRNAGTLCGSQTLVCSVCHVVTDVESKRQHNDFTAKHVKRLKALREVGKCTVCTKEEGKAGEQAEVWCTSCQVSLCSACMPGHNRYNKSHRTIALKEVASWTEGLEQVEGPQCPQHGRPLELLCLDCRLAKCTACLSRCESSGHAAPQLLRGPKGESLLAEVRASVQHLHKLVLSKSQLLLKPEQLAREIQSARAAHLDELESRKVQAMDILNKGYEEAKRELEDSYERLDESASILQSLAEELKQPVLHASKYVSSLTDVTNSALLLEQQSTMASRLQALSKQLDGFAEIPDGSQLVTVSKLLPEHLNEVVTSWLGTPKLSTDLGRELAAVLNLKDEAGTVCKTVQEQQLVFSRDVNRFQLPFDCRDLSLTSDGHLLLAAEYQGMKEFEMGGIELSTWTPPRLSNGMDDRVTTVAALDDGRAAVGVFWSALVVLLRRSSTDSEWHVDRHVVQSPCVPFTFHLCYFAELQSPPWQISVQGDLAAVAQYRHDAQQWVPGPQLQLIRLSDGLEIYADSREYSILSVALAAMAVVTTSYEPVKLGGCREVHVVDCCSHRGELLWRHELGSEEWVAGVCLAPTGQLYLAVHGRGRSRTKDCVRVINRENGKRLEDVLVSTTHGLKLPARLSLSRGQKREHLAVLSLNGSNDEWNTVSVYASVAQTGAMPAAPTAAEAPFQFGAAVGMAAGAACGVPAFGSQAKSNIFTSGTRVMKKATRRLPRK